ncbi:MAG TPA: methyl coenzyme M reductase-arginine methyltransferase Mmp10 [Methanoregulaceae archaeon]|nr:methyl coenzyme M reductase-arginine methyltransferase Mmp10 [Methanoregulaceae archaeon]HPA07975.1 methyl coenzyme M reductase-arginine methyltransferase Mmp10 [Methanoregulaceae archaeon]HQN90213.1 methyl coenzyme M reductase-arginine methyltransferase Mmp10 [Methanoregulaceae archaeon]HQP81670.1 methyl coenzyme M reductase-arginine methyltransferase Mmp10 [Methanoregulaceae archaeon]
MAHLTVDIGGKPGVNCRGFCEYCYFKHVKEVPPFGCRHCPPYRVGCDYCSRSVREYYQGWKSLRQVGEETLATLQMMTGDVERVTISGGGDPSCYPEFTDLIELLAGMEVPLHIGYTSGKGFDDVGIADFLIDHGLAEVSFTVFSVDPAKRKRYMHDPTPDVSLKILERLCGEIEVYGAAVVLPGINDGKALEETCQWLDDRGAKGLILMRFANRTDQGLILGNSPVIKGQPVQSPQEFQEMVTDLAKQFNMKISGTPLWDPAIGSPFAIRNEPDLLDKLPLLQRRATVITGSIAAPAIQAILDARGGGVNVIGTRKEIACLITADDLNALDLAEMESLVVIPGRAFVHDREAERILTADGNDRTVLRGPEMLTADAETSMGMTREGVLLIELEGFSGLIAVINRYGQDSP